MTALVFNLVLLAVFTLTLVLIVLLIFGTIEKQQPRNSLGMRTGKPRYYFLFSNEKVQVRHFMLIYVASLFILAYFLYKIYG